MITLSRMRTPGHTKIKEQINNKEAKKQRVFLLCKENAVLTSLNCAHLVSHLPTLFDFYELEKL